MIRTLDGKTNKRKPRLSLYILLFIAGATLLSIAHAGQTSTWKTVYKDTYNYSQQSPKDSTFNTWFWREDSAASHEFEVTAGDGCTAQTPCVKLTAQAYPASAKYTNAEMYNNSCIKNPQAGDNSQQLSTLNNGVWGKPLYNRIISACDIPYPYQTAKNYLQPYGLKSSWTTQLPAHLDANPFSFTVLDKEEPWKATRDITFNNPYRADISTAMRITMDIKAETKDQGGSRGWGFWNTSLDPDFLQLAWFMEYSIPEAYLSATKKNGKSNRQVVMQTIGHASDGQSFKICSTVLSKPDIYQWHKYSIEWRHDAVRYFVDGKLVADHRKITLDKHMAFHNWVDNRNYNIPVTNPVKIQLATGKTNVAVPANFPLTRDKSNYIRSFLVQSSPDNKLPPLSGNGKGQCKTLNKNDIALLIDLLKILAKDYLK